jgi:hypothetical protein
MNRNDVLRYERQIRELENKGYYTKADGSKSISDKLINQQQ